MKLYKKLVGQSLIYGLGTMVPRLLNYIILTPIFTRLLSETEYGKLTELYSYITFLMVLLTYGMETSYFRFVNKDTSSRKVFSTISTSIITTSLFFMLLIYLSANFLSDILKYEGESSFIKIIALIVGIEAITAIPFAKIRIEERALRFAILKTLIVVINIFLLLLFYRIIPIVIGNNNYLLNSQGQLSVKYILISNMLTSCFMMVLLVPEFKQYRFKDFSFKLLKPILFFGLPLLISGLAGTVNETFDRIVLKQLIVNKEIALYNLGIYGANFKIASLILLFIQVYRFSIEPFFFNYAKQNDSKEQYSRIMRYYICIVLFLCMSIYFFLDIIKFFVDAKFHAGLNIVPIVMVSYLLYGIYFNLSVWFKLVDKTMFAILITFIGAAITLLINIYYIPKYGFIACAYGHVIAYLVMVVVTYLLGRKYFYINYRLPLLFMYLCLAVALTLIMKLFCDNYVLRILLLFIFVYVVAKSEGLIKYLKGNYSWKLK